MVGQNTEAIHRTHTVDARCGTVRVESQGCLKFTVGCNKCIYKACRCTLLSMYSLYPFVVLAGPFKVDSFVRERRKVRVVRS